MINTHKLCVGTLVGIVGKSGSGKDTSADFLHDSYPNVWTHAFADPLKDAAATAFGIPQSHFYERTLKEQTNSLWGVSPRKIAQFLGTEMFRETIGKLIPLIGVDFWVYRMELLLSNNCEDSPLFDSQDTVIITDVRFDNEINWILASGGYIIHLTRPDKPTDEVVGIPNHQSEAPVNINYDHERVFQCVNDSNLQNLFTKMDSIYKQIIESKLSKSLGL